MSGGGGKLTKFGKLPATVSSKCQVSGVENKGSQILEEEALFSIGVAWEAFA